MSRFWPFGGSTRPEPEASTTSAFEFHSRAFEYALEQHLSGRPWGVLDLGPASNETLHFFMGLGSRYVVEDLWGTVASCRSVGTLKADCLRRLPDLLAYDDGTLFDLVLAWDLLDHLGTEALEVVAAKLAPLCRPGSLIHALVSRSENLHAHPLRYTIVDRGTIRHPCPEPPRTEQSPRHTDSSLARGFAPFAVEKTFLLKHGIQEYLFERPGAEDDPD